MINFEWQKPILEVKLVDGTLENVIVTVHWRYKGTNENEISAEVYGANALETPSEENFVPFDELTNEDISKWLESILDIKQMQENIINQIDLIENPITIIKTID